MKIAILGNGLWGQALSTVLQTQANQISLIGPDQRISDQEILINAVPAQFIRRAFSNIQKDNNLKWIINTSKGIEKQSHKFPFEIIQEFFSSIPYATLSGPSFAKEITEKMPTTINLASKGENLIEIVNLFSKGYFNIIESKSYQAIELAAAFKNVYAIACGISDGLGFKSNTRTRLILMAYKEIQILIEAFRLESDQYSMPGILGDLILTCNSEESRNFCFGELLATKTITQALREINSTVEGYTTTDSLEYIISDKKIDLPLASFIIETIHKDDPSTLKPRLIAL